MTVFTMERNAVALCPIIISVFRYGLMGVISISDCPLFVVILNLFAYLSYYHISN